LFNAALAFGAVPDLRTYIDEVLEDQDKVLLTEASECFAAGAHRAAYITIWLATAESLRRKFVEASVRDHQAGAILRQIQQREAQHKAVDGLLIEKAQEYGFITDAEATRLKHIYESRNVFGHPYEERPSEQLVSTAASEAVDIVLGRPVALREGYLSQQVTRLTTDPTFLRDDADAVKEYARLVQARSAADRRVWFLHKLFSALDGVFADPSMDRLQRRGVWFVRAFLQADPQIFDEWDAADDLPDHRQVLAGILAVDELFPVLSDHAQDIVVNVLIQEASTDLIYLELLDGLGASGVLRDVHQAALDHAIEGFPAQRLFASNLPLRALLPRLIETLKSYSWQIQNQAIPPLQNAGPEGVAELSDAAQETLGRNVMQAAEGSAFSAINFLGAVGIGDAEWPTPFVRGVAMEAIVHEDGALRLKTGQMDSALRLLARVPDPDRRQLIEEIVEAIGAGTPRRPEQFRQERDEAVQALRRVAGEPGLGAVGAIAEAIEDVSVEDED
jgi:hypothetical protein